MIEATIYKFLYGEQGFRPFRIHLSNGVVFDVPHMDYAMLPPHRQYVIIESMDKPMVRLNLAQITHVEETTMPAPPPDFTPTTGHRS